MKGIVLFVAGFLCGAVGVWGVLSRQGAVVSPIVSFVSRPLDAYTIDALSKKAIPATDIVFSDPVATTSSYTTVPFSFLSFGKRVSGVAHIPTAEKPQRGYPVIVQFRGYANRDTYYPGQGTEHSAEVFAANGFLSLAPDFLGYGESDMPSSDVFEERFETYTTALSLLFGIRSIPIADSSRVGLWGHSNGGHIALTVSEIAANPYPLVLWAPVSKPFPYSILYYTDEAEDNGKALRSSLAAFESLYDASLYSFRSDLSRIKGPIAIHQGTSDDAVPKVWSDDVVKALEAAGKEVTYFVYPGADHNMMPSWNTVMERTISFYKNNL